jgi:hypothetical protein
MALLTTASMRPRFAANSAPAFMIAPRSETSGSIGERLAAAGADRVGRGIAVACIDVDEANRRAAGRKFCGRRAAEAAPGARHEDR